MLLKSQSVDANMRFDPISMLSWMPNYYSAEPAANMKVDQPKMTEDSV
jgi:hypothetical protein